jgi:uncharacterized protein (TIGR03000 family)
VRPGYWGNRRFYPSYGWYGSYPSYYSAYPYAWSAPVYDPGYYSDYGSLTPSYFDGDAVDIPPAAPYQAYYPPMTGSADTTPVLPDNTARVTVSVPPGADVWIDGSRTTSTGSVREFQTPPLTPGGQYTYEVRARWYENGQEVTQTQQVPITAGAHVQVTFPVVPTNAGIAPNP